MRRPQIGLEAVAQQHAATIFVDQFAGRDAGGASFTPGSSTRPTRIAPEAFRSWRPCEVNQSAPSRRFAHPVERLDVLLQRRRPNRPTCAT